MSDEFIDSLDVIFAELRAENAKLIEDNKFLIKEREKLAAHKRQTADYDEIVNRKNTAEAKVAELLRKFDDLKVYLTNKNKELAQFDEVFEKGTLNEAILIHEILQKLA